MTEPESFASLSMKDLRQLAGEHQISNRSRLGREDLIEALQAAIAARSADPTAAPTAEPAGASAPVAEPASTAVAAEMPPVQPVAAAPAAPVAAEPELLTPESVAGLAAEPEQAGAPEEGEPAAGQGFAEEPGQPGMPGDGRRRRRRRRRGRGRGRNGDPNQPFVPGQSGPDGQGQPADEGADDGAEGEDDGADEGDQQPEAAAPVQAPAAQPVQPQRPPQPQQQFQRQQPQQQPQRNQDFRQGGQPRDPRDPRDQQQRDQRPPRPRLEGPQRPVGSVLDRLCTFSRGLLELCDPSTPTWAQPRIAELLAEAGVTPIPATGQPHPDFHQVVGTVATGAVPPGHIAEVVAPGFALRGDRGDLFCLRKVQVKVAPGGDLRPQPGPAPAPRPAQPEAPRAPQADAPAPVADIVPAVDPAPAPAPAPAPIAEPAVPTDPAPAPAPAAPVAPPVDRAPSQPAPQPQPQRQAPPPPPAQGRPPLRTHVREPAGDAPALPLAPQVPDELAARPKAEGFRSLGLNEQILADVAAIGWKDPSPIQTAAIPVVLAGRDMMGQAQTGTGKTGAFALPILQRLYGCAPRPAGSPPLALVLAPTRELARQVQSEFLKMAGASGARSVVIYGGVPMDEQFRALERGPHIVVGTPGRIIDHMKRHTLDLSKLEVFVLDEADQMLDIGFWPDVQYIASHTPPSRQLLLFSATFPEPIKELVSKHMKDPEHIQIAPKKVTVDEVDQKYIAVARERKNELLAHFIETFNPPQLVVFCRTKHQTDRVAEVLKRKNMSAGAIHGDLPQSRRERMLGQFREGSLQCLVATNVAARGLDIPAISHVVNYDIPEMPEEYVHRIGRTARNGARGVARTFITPEDGQFLLEIEKHIGLLLEEEVIDGFSQPVVAGQAEAHRTIAAMPVGGTPRLLKPLVGGIKLGRRRR